MKLLCMMIFNGMLLTMRKEKLFNLFNCYLGEVKFVRRKESDAENSFS